MDVMETNTTSFSSQRKQGKILDILKEKILQLRNDLEAYEKTISNCQMRVNQEIRLRTEAETVIYHLQSYNTNLECKLNQAQQEVQEARATICKNEIQRQTLEQRLQTQADKIELLEEEVINLNHQVKDADRNALHSLQLVNKLTESLACSEKQVQESRIMNMNLEDVLKADAQNLHCIERAFEQSSQKVIIADRRIVQLEQCLLESERRAYQAELHIQELQQNYHNLEQDLEKRWLYVLRKLVAHISASY